LSSPVDIAPAHRRLPQVDYDGLAEELFALKTRTEASLCEDDFRHLKKVIWWNRISTILGYATAWILPNPISAYLISQGLFGRWMITHHVSHGGYDKVPGIPARYTSKVFAQGKRRWIDWYDWIQPDAWHFEHDILHHCNTNEERDPDLVEDHVEFLRQGGYPRWMRFIIIGFVAMTWKFTYYAPNTLRCLDEKDYHNGMKGLRNILWENALNFRHKRVRRLWLCSYLPYVSFYYVAVPLLFLPLGPQASLFVLLNRLMAEILTNIHTFCVITPNHAGDDLYRFDYHFKGKGEWCVNQIVSSCNYHCGSDRVDYLQGWLNYQIEHHLFPRLPMLKYQQMQPEVKEICERHGVPYVQESIVKRVWQLVSISVGRCEMKWLRAEECVARPSSQTAPDPLDIPLPAHQPDEAPPQAVSA
jgi:fatty acid desaturase